MRHMPHVKSRPSAYVDALTMLARRELSEAQIRRRLAGHGHTAIDIDSACARMREAGAIDDMRVARAMALTQTSVKRRGKARVRAAIEAVGIAPDISRRVVDEVFGNLDMAELLESALARRLRSERPIADEREFRRLYRYLVSQGFEHGRILKVLSARRA